MKKHFVGATYDLTQKNMNYLILQLEESQALLDEVIEENNAMHHMLQNCFDSYESLIDKNTEYL